jgi:tetraacyldisaccharide 4'-kinase
VKPVRAFLLPVSFLYWLITAVRNWFFDIGILRVTRLHVPVVSVGNISAGGTGKTPFVEVLVRKLQSKGRKPAVVSRGYGRRTTGYLMVSGEGTSVAQAIDAGDEPVQLAHQLRDTPIVVDEDRVEGAQKVLEESSADCIVLDDGFQHRYLARELNIVLLTAREILERQWMLPAGNRRESIHSLHRADLIVLSKCKNLLNYEDAVKRLTDWKSDNIAGFRLAPVALRNVSNGECFDRRSAKQIPVLIFSGVGDPNSFKQSVEEFGCSIVKSIEFPDHHWYSGNDLKRLRDKYEEHSAKLVITTQKDLVRLRSLEKSSEEFFKDLHVHVLEVAPDFIAGEEIIDRMIEKLIR